MLCACNHEWIPSGLHIHNIYISTLGILGCPFDAHWIPRWFPFGYTLGTLDFQLGPIAMPMGSPCHSHMGSHWSSIGSPWYSHRVHPLYVHEIPMGSPVGSPWIPMWSHRCFSMRCTCGVSLLPGWFPFPRFSAETVFLVASLVASAPGQCGGAQPGMPCLGKHIVSIPPGMVFCVASIYQ